MTETYDSHPPFAVTDAEYHRLLGYPRGHEPGERVRELKAGARAWFARHGRPWIYLRRVELQTEGSELRLGGVPFASPQLHAHLRAHGARSAVLLAVSAGAECEEEARRLWTEGKPDEYFFLEMFGSAVVEDLVARASGRTCEVAGAQGLRAIPHYSPGYTGWDVAEQNKLFALVTGGMSRPFPGPLEVLSSGMLRPKKSLLAVFGLTPGLATAPAATPCENCGFTPCNFRRAPYRHTPAAAPESLPAAPAAAGPLTRDARYAVNARALRKWAGERVRLEFREDGSVEAVFRFDGTTCSNQGRPLAFDYRVSLGGPDENYCIRTSSCAPAPGDEGYQSTCAYLSDPDKFMQDIAADHPLLGRPLDEVLAWSRTPAPAGCHCSADSRAHKWGLALEVIHYALVQARTPQTVS